MDGVAAAEGEKAVDVYEGGAGVEVVRCVEDVCVARAALSDLWW